MDQIRSRVNAVRRRHQWQWMWTCCSWGLIAGGVVGCMLGVLRAVGFHSISWSAVALSVLLCPALGILFAIFRHRAMRDAAVSIDRAYGLKDRVATALNFISENRPSAPLRALQIADATAHVDRIDPARVAPIHAPRPWWYGLTLTTAAIVLCILTAPPQQATASLVANDVVSAQARRISDELQQLEQFKDQDGNSEVQQLIKQLAAKVEELKQPGVDPKEALAKLSEMEAALEKQQHELNEQNVEAALKELGEALSLAEPLQAAGQAMSQGNLDKAAEQLAKADMPQLDRKTEKAVTERLDEQSKQNSGSGSNRSLNEATDKVSQGLTQGDRNKFKNGMQGLASECEKQGHRKKLLDMLRKQCQCLCECKGECECECKNDAECNRKGGSKAGTARSGNQPGDKTPKLKTGQEMKLTGQESSSGESDVETQTAPEQEQNAVRQYREHSKKYEQIAESALEAEPIPLGHRQTIRRYFELIRPQNTETDATINAAEK